MRYDFVIGMDVGKYFHHASVLDHDGTQVLSKRVNQDEAELRKLFGKYIHPDRHVLVVVDQPNNIGRLTVTVAQDMGGYRAISWAGYAPTFTCSYRQRKDRRPRCWWPLGIDHMRPSYSVNLVAMSEGRNKSRLEPCSSGRC